MYASLTSVALQQLCISNLVLQIQHFMYAIANQEWSFINERFSIDSIVILANTKRLFQINYYYGIKTNISNRI